MNLCMHEWVCTFVCVVLERRKISLERQMTTIKGNKDICQHTTMATCKKNSTLQRLEAGATARNLQNVGCTMKLKKRNIIEHTQIIPTKKACTDILTDIPYSLMNNTYHIKNILFTFKTKRRKEKVLACVIEDRKQQKVN